MRFSFVLVLFVALCVMMISAAPDARRGYGHHRYKGGRGCGYGGCGRGGGGYHGGRGGYGGRGRYYRDVSNVDVDADTSVDSSEEMVASGDGDLITPKYLPEEKISTNILPNKPIILMDPTHPPMLD